MIVLWKNDGKETNKKLKLFRIRFDLATGEWVRDPKGKYWGFHELRVAKKDVNLNVDLTLGTPSLGVVKDEE